jgi:hypothetical protein
MASMSSAGATAAINHAVLPVAVLIAHCAPALPFPVVPGRLRCQACGSKDVHARPNWKGLR